MKIDDLQKKVDKKYASVSKYLMARGSTAKRALIISIAVLLIITLGALFVVYRCKAESFYSLFPFLNPLKVKVVPYSGSCQCPADRDNRGALCGERSAWSKGASVVCYDDGGKILRR